MSDKNSEKYPCCSFTNQIIKTMENIIKNPNENNNKVNIVFLSKENQKENQKKIQTSLINNQKEMLHVFLTIK